MQAQGVQDVGGTGDQSSRRCGDGRGGGNNGNHVSGSGGTSGGGSGRRRSACGGAAMLKAKALAKGGGGLGGTREPSQPPGPGRERPDQPEHHQVTTHAAGLGQPGTHPA